MLYDKEKPAEKIGNPSEGGAEKEMSMFDTECPINSSKEIDCLQFTPRRIL